MNKEMLDILNDLSKKTTTELALQIMELSSENLILKQQCKKQKEVIDKIYELIKQHIRKDGFLELNEWQTRDLLDILKEGKNE